MANGHNQALHDDPDLSLFLIYYVCAPEAESYTVDVCERLVQHAAAAYRDVTTRRAASTVTA